MDRTMFVTLSGCIPLTFAKTVINRLLEVGRLSNVIRLLTLRKARMPRIKGVPSQNRSVSCYPNNSGSLIDIVNRYYWSRMRRANDRRLSSCASRGLTAHAAKNRTSI